LRLPNWLRIVLVGLALVVLAIAACPRPPAPVSPVVLGRALLGEPLAQQGYSILLEGTDVVAGRDCLTVRLKPPEKHMPWRQVWLDRETLRLVASRDWNGDDRVVGTSIVESP
jgi:hypothetical protein